MNQDDLLRMIKEGNRRFQRLKLPPPTVLVPSSSPVEWPRARRTEHIDVSVDELGDLVALVQKYGPLWRQDTVYNIDMKALLQIQGELEQLHALVGLKQFKNAVLDQLLYFLQNLHLNGTESDFLHTILCGPPGAGKTEIAKILGKMYAKLGILKNGIFKKVTRADLIGGYLGQTAIKTTKVIQECLGGCLFIDEAYSLATNSSGDSYSKECLDTLCEALSDHKANLMVIIAGYEKDLHETIFQTNRGLESRFIWRFVIDDYTAKDLRDIFLKKVADNHWSMMDDTLLTVSWFEQRKKDFPHLGRDMELLFSYTKCCHGRRIFGQVHHVHKELQKIDIENGHEMLLRHRRKKTAYEIPGFYV